MLVKAVLGAAALIARPLPVVEALEGVLQRMGGVYPLFTFIVFVALLACAAVQRWPLWRVFCSPLLLFLLANKIVHEHYLLQILPLLFALGTNLRGLSIVYGAYLLTAGTPLRFLPPQVSMPPGPHGILLPELQPTAGMVVNIGLMVLTALAAIVFGWHVMRLLRLQEMEGGDGDVLLRLRKART